MPIIIDQNNPLQDIERITKEIKSDDHSPKFFSSKLTGEGKNRGLIDKDVVLLKDQLIKHGDMLMEDTGINARLLDDLIKQTMHIGSYRSASTASDEPTPMYVDKERHEDDFNRIANLYEIEDTISLETINPLLINDFTFDMDMPLDTVLWDIDNVKDWSIIDENSERTLQGKVLFSHMTLLHHEEKVASGAKKHKYPFILTPFLMLSVSSKHATPTRVTINKNNARDKDAYRVRIVPLRIGTTPNADPSLPNHLSLEFGNPSMPFLDIGAEDSMMDFTSNYAEFGDTHNDKVELANNGIMDFVLNTNIYETLTEQSKRYKDESMDQFVRIMTELKNMYGNDPALAPHTARVDLVASLYSLINQLEHIEKQGGKISTDDLNEVYEAIVDMKIVTDNDKNNIVKQSLRLLLAHRLNALDKATANGDLYDFDPQFDNITENVENSSMYSKQQKEIILSREPLAIGQAGAGSGKSHTVTGRIHYLQAQQEDLDKVMVLSFTNVAAQNIISRFPGVKSRTLADMFHTIYKASFTKQQLSTPGTLVNSLTLLNPHSAYFTNHLGHNGTEVAETITRLRNVLGGFVMKFGKNNDVQNNMRVLMNLVDEKRDLIVDILDATEQTTLELEPIIIHSFLNTDPSRLSMPDEFKNLNMIITDESQDISTFEYIMLIDMALHYGCQLLIVGDGSQTLYEFRNSDPRYLNALEASGVFKTYKLETNYRSNPEVLAFANQFLQVIEANDIANIQLRANTLKGATPASFKEKMTVFSAQPMDPDRKTRTNIIEDHMLYNHSFLDWFYERIDKGEQIAFLAHTRRDVAIAEEVLNKLLQDHGITEEVTNIVSKRTYEKKYISDVLIAVRTEFTQLNAGSADFVNDAYDLLDENNPQVRRCFGKGITAKHLSFNVQDIQDTFSKVISQPMVKMMRREVAAGQRTSNEVMNFILQAMLREETRSNNMQHVLEPKQELDLANKQVIVSTIHAAKGLEFDHTIVAYHERGASSRADKDKMQEDLRMLFVACSRAKDTQWVINTQLNPARSVSNHMSSMYATPMTTAYLRAIDQLEEEQKKAKI